MRMETLSAAALGSGSPARQYGRSNPPRLRSSARLLPPPPIRRRASAQPFQQPLIVKRGLRPPVSRCIERNVQRQQVARVEARLDCDQAGGCASTSPRRPATPAPTRSARRPAPGGSVAAPDAALLSTSSPVPSALRNAGNSPVNKPGQSRHRQREKQHAAVNRHFIHRGMPAGASMSSAVNPYRASGNPAAPPNTASNRLTVSHWRRAERASRPARRGQRPRAGGRWRAPATNPPRWRRRSTQRHRHRRQQQQQERARLRPSSSNSGVRRNRQPLFSFGCRFGQTGGEGRQSFLRLFRRLAGLQASDDLQNGNHAAARSRKAAHRVRDRSHRHPQIHFAVGHRELRRHNPLYAPIRTIDRERGADRVRRRAEAPAPQRIADDDHAVAKEYCVASVIATPSVCAAEKTLPLAACAAKS